MHSLTAKERERNQAWVEKLRTSLYKYYCIHQFLLLLPSSSNLSLIISSAVLKHCFSLQGSTYGFTVKPDSYVIFPIHGSRPHDPNRRHGVKATIVITPANAPLFSKTIERERELGVDISLRTIEFPCAEAGLPEACKNVNSITCPEMEINFYKAIGLLQQPFEQLLEEYRPNCLVADMMITWATEAAAKFEIPFALSVYYSLMEHEPYKAVTSDYEPFVVLLVKLTRQQLSPSVKVEPEKETVEMVEQGVRAEMTSYGVLVNSFYELEPAYAQHYRKVIGRKAWHIGPVSLCNRDANEKAQQGVDEHECLRWLDSKQPKSVLYVCFGSMVRFSAADQLLEIAIGLEASRLNFIWVVKKEDWLPEGFETRVEGRGLIIRGWAPQVLILDHEAIGGSLTHCGLGCQCSHGLSLRSSFIMKNWLQMFLK